MPEITSVKDIRAKLSEFDERMDGAITAAKTLARIKTDAEKLLADLQDISAKSEQSLQKVDGIQLQLQNLHHDWEALKKQVDRTQAESKEIHTWHLSELDSAIDSIGTKLVEAEARLAEATELSLANQAALLKRLDESTRSNAEAAATAKTLVLERADKLNELLVTARDELQGKVNAELRYAEELLDLQFKEIEQKTETKLQSATTLLADTAKNNEHLLREQMDSFKEEMKRTLSEHQQTLDRQLTDFLNKQNALVQNLTQQIDSYSRLSQAQSTELAEISTRLKELSSELAAHKTQTTNDLTALAVSIPELKALLAKVESSSQATAAQLDETIEKLKKVPLVGGKFK